MLWWTHQQLRARNPQTRLAVVEKLASAGEEKSIAPLMLALKDKEADVRCAAAKALVKFQDRRAVAPLIEMLKDTVPLARAAASEALGHLGDPAATDRLVPLLRDQDPIVRAVAARSLHRLGWRPSTDAQKINQILALGNLQQLLTMGPEAVEPLLELMRYGPPNKQLSAVKTLGQIKDPRLVRTMLEALKKESPACASPPWKCWSGLLIRRRIPKWRNCSRTPAPACAAPPWMRRRVAAGSARCRFCSLL